MIREDEAQILPLCVKLDVELLQRAHICHVLSLLFMLIVALSAKEYFIDYVQTRVTLHAF